MGKVREKSGNVLKSLKKSWSKKLRKIAEEKVASTAVAGWRDQGREGKVASWLISCLILTRLFILSHILPHTYKALYYQTYVLCG